MDWSSYNEALVRRGEILLNLDVIDEWEEELEDMNEGKVGSPYDYPDSLMRLLGFVHALLHLPYRQTEGFTRALSRHVKGLMAPDYTVINRRVNRLGLDLGGLEDIQPDDEPLTLAVDASGVKVHNGGDWIRRVWKVRKGYLKIHLAVDVKSHRIVALEVTSEKVHDSRRLRSLVKKARRAARVGRVLADGAYDSRANFQFLAEQGIEPIIRVRANSAPKAYGCPARKAAVEQQRGRRAWAERHGYGFRWRAEGAFSWIKRTFGEYVSAKKFAYMAKEMILKASLYNLFIALTPKA